MSDLPDGSKNQQLSVLLLVLGLVVACLAAAVPFLVVPQFRSTFAEIGFDLPWFTRTALSWYPLFLALPLVVLAAWWLWPNTSQRGVACVAIGVGGSTLLTIILIAALQYPILHAAKSLIGAY